MGGGSKAGWTPQRPYMRQRITTSPGLFGDLGPLGAIKKISRNPRHFRKNSVAFAPKHSKCASKSSPKAIVQKKIGLLPCLGRVAGCGGRACVCVSCACVCVRVWTVRAPKFHVPPFMGIPLDMNPSNMFVFWYMPPKVANFLLAAGQPFQRYLLSHPRGVGSGVKNQPPFVNKSVWLPSNGQRPLLGFPFLQGVPADCFGGGGG